MALHELNDLELVDSLMERKPNLSELEDARAKYLRILQAKDKWRTYDSIFGSSDIWETTTHNLVLNIHNYNRALEKRTHDCSHFYMLVKPDTPMDYKVRSAESGKMYLPSDLTDEERVEFDAIAANALINIYEGIYHYMIKDNDMQRSVFKTEWTDDLIEVRIDEK